MAENETAKKRRRKRTYKGYNDDQRIATVKYISSKQHRLYTNFKNEEYELLKPYIDRFIEEYPQKKGRKGRIGAATFVKEAIWDKVERDYRNGERLRPPENEDEFPYMNTPEDE